MQNVWNPAFVDPGLDCRAVTFENPTGARGAGGSAHGGRKGAPNRRIEAGERVVLADLEGPGTLRHIWMTFPPAPPETMRALWLEVFYDGAARAERLGALPRLLRPAARPPGRLRTRRSTAVAGGPRLQRLLPDAVPRATSASS